MPKFSIIVPVYNVEKYIKKCIDSILEQTFKDYEVIVVNDGTKDKSIERIQDYPVKIITQENKGLSEARNFGVMHTTGEYILFVDSDDSIEKDLLQNIYQVLDNKPDVVRYQIRNVYDNGITEDYQEEGFINKTGVDAFTEICKYHFVETACCYAIKRDYYIKHQFSFKRNTYHEDFGLIPLVIMKANCVNSISYIGYNYMQRMGSIMNNNDYSKTKKKVEDVYEHYLWLKQEIEKTNLDATIFKSFLANSVIRKSLELNASDYKQMRKKLKQQKVYQDLLENSFPQKIKKQMIKISPKLYYRVR